MADGTFRAADVPEDILWAIEAVTKVFEDALVTGKHQPGDWRALGVNGNLKHAINHYSSLLTVEGKMETLILDDDEDHLANLCCRALMLLQLREEARRALPNK